MKLDLRKPVKDEAEVIDNQVEEKKDKAPTRKKKFKKGGGLAAWLAKKKLA